MNINIKNFKDFLRKSTMNYYIDTVQVNLDFETNRVWTRMVSSSKDSVVMLDKENNVFQGVKDDVQLNFAQPRIEIKPFLELIDSEESELKIHKNKMIIDNQLKIHFDDPSIIGILNEPGKMNDIEYGSEKIIDSDFFEKYNKIKKIGSRFGQIYVSVSDGKMYIETTDKGNDFSNGIKYYLCETQLDDCDLCFEYQPFISLMGIIEEGSLMKISIINEGGLLYISSKDETEKYFLMSLME